MFVTSEVLSFDRTDRRAAYDRLQAPSAGPHLGRRLRLPDGGHRPGRVMVDPIMALWDAAAMPVILEEAGGTFTDGAANPTISRRRHRHNGLLLKEVLAAVR